MTPNLVLITKSDLGKLEMLLVDPHAQKILKSESLDHQLKESEVSCLEFGPFDNQYILLGLTNGTLLGFDPVSLA